MLKVCINENASISPFVCIAQKMWTICDIVLNLLMTKTNTYDNRDAPVDARIPSMYFQVQPDGFEQFTSDGQAPYDSGAQIARTTNLKRPTTTTTAAASVATAATSADDDDAGQDEDCSATTADYFERHQAKRKKCQI